MKAPFFYVCLSDRVAIRISRKFKGVNTVKAALHESESPWVLVVISEAGIENNAKQQRHEKIISSACCIILKKSVELRFW